MPKIRFRAKLTAIGSQTILRLPQAASSKLPSRGMSVVEGTFNGHAFQTPLEPDGTGSHWLRVSHRMLKAARAEMRDSVSVPLEPMAPWPEPKVPADLAEALASDPQARSLWMDITPVARWDWIRWIGPTRDRDVAFEETFVRAIHQRAGLRVRDFRRGEWWTGVAHDQDVLAVTPNASPSS
jgi:Domain of unknown function (DUF1905)/Bacteriocin-protection, YdeI or OmpD-Associated